MNSTARLLAAATSVMAVSTGSVWAQTPASPFPSKPIRIVVALASGGGVDTTARFIGQRFTDAWGQQVVVENRPGAGGTIAAELVARSAPDGHTLLVNSSGHVITASLYRLSYDPVRDFAPITLAALSPSVLVVHPSLPVRSVKELVALARARPGELLWSSSGTGSAQHLAMELFVRLAGVKMLHVPYKGTAPSITDLIGGRVSVTTASIVSTMPQVRAGRLRAIAVTSNKRSQAQPDLPTVAESGVPGFGVDQWYGLFAPAGTPKEIVARLYGEVSRSLSQPEVREKLLGVGLEVVGSTPESFTDYARAEMNRWAKLVRESGVKVE